MEANHVLSTFNEHGVEYVVVGRLAAALRGAGSPPGGVDACFHQTWNNCECLSRALEQLGAQLDPPWSVPIPVTGELRQARDPLRFATAEGPVTLQPSVLGLGSYDDLAPWAGDLDLQGLPVRVLTVEQLHRWAERACKNGELDPASLLLELWQLQQVQG